MDAAVELLAQRSAQAVTLREITDAAGANVAAVSYHFGSLKSLCDAAIERALERYLDAQERAVGALEPESTLEALAAAFARPMISALTAGGSEFDVMRTVARAGADPPREWDRLNERFERSRAAVLPLLRTHLPGVKDEELIFRTRCAAGLLNWLALAPLGAELRTKSARQIERLLIPVVAGAFRGTSTAS
jgi:AcrR family transcriptional regulator